MVPLEPSALARLQKLARVTAIYSVALVLSFQGYGIARGLLSGTISDAWLGAMPAVWFDVSLVVLLAFLWGLTFSGSQRAERGWKTWLVPDFTAIRTELRSTRTRRAILVAGTVYAAVIAILTGLVVIDPAGTIAPGPAGYPFLDVFDAPLGWGPKFVWAPDPFVMVSLRPFNTASVALLAVLASFGMGLVGALWGRARVHQGRNAAGAVAGLLVMCPACAVSPTFAFFAGVLTPTAAGAGTAAARLAIGPVMAFSTAMLLASVVLMWVGIARTSRVLAAAPRAELLPGTQVNRASRLAAWALAAALVLALGALLVDLSAATRGATGGEAGAHGGGETPETAATVHPPAAIVLGSLGTALAGLGLWFGAPRLALSRRLALAAGLTLLYAAGIVHWFAILEHLGEGPTAAFFLATGSVQIVATPLARRREALLWWIGVAFTGFLIALYAVTRFAPPPLGLEPEPVDSLGVLAIVAEGGTLVGLGLYLRGRMVSARLSNALLRGPPLAILLAAALATDAVIGVEAIWGFLSLSAFLLLALLLIALIVSAALAHVRRTKPLVGLTWAVAVTLIALSLVQAWYFALASLTIPVVLCLTSASMLVAPLLFPIRGGRVRIRGLVAG